ncbi:protein-(glutamine-N5) methyltransferase, release factor-specific [Gammaproteobacteria bacterium 42_54_T18]|nr:protein-(glutamine-N5) methyltransferase, release factor-specific [Gammaproteobacteria bacterium 42_54_T18]
MITVKQAQQRAVEVLLLSSDTAHMDVNILVGHCLQKSRTWLMTWPDAALTDDQVVELEGYVARRVKGEPIAYIVGEQEFWSLPLKVNRFTLIPRPETELLVELALEKIIKKNATILDLGTGSGAIPFALKSEHPDWQVTGLDFSQDALNVAKENADRLQLVVDFIQSDWFEKIPEQLFDLVISNPPYIDGTDKHLAEGDVRFEPDTALIADEQGYGDIRRISCEASRYLTDGGLLMFEHGFEQGAGVRRILKDSQFDEIETIKDLAGLDRVTIGRWRSAP